MIDRPTVDRIIDAANIVEVVSEFVTLKKRGANYIGLCPFHNDSHPSFSVSPSRGICHCFTCGKGGNAVNFLMEIEQMTYPDALRWLAKKYNIDIQERQLSDEERQRETDRESMFIVNEWAAAYFERILHDDVDGRAIGMQYFRSRGFRDDIIRKFRLGFSLADRGAMPRTALQAGYKAAYLTMTGLCYERDDHSLVDRFAGRAIFPWIGVGGKVVAFGGRVLDQRTKGVNQKYVNSPDSDIYHKERELYGIYQAKKAIAKEDCVYMVEGYTDVISMHQCGLENVVANSGTALSTYQIRLLHRFTQNIVLLYDGDEAGIHAALRGTNMLLQEGMNIKVVLLPDGADPDSFARNHTAADFRQFIAQHQEDFIAFKTRVLLHGVTDPVKRSEAINSIVESIALITDQITRATYIHDCAQRLGIGESTLISQMNRFIRAGIDRRRPGSSVAVPSGDTTTATTPSGQPQSATPTLVMPIRNTDKSDDVERMLAQIVMRHGEKMITVETHPDGEESGTITLPVAEYIQADLEADGLHLANTTYEAVINECVDHLDDPDFQATRYFTLHHDPAISQLAARLTADPIHVSPSLQTEFTADKLRGEVVQLVMTFRLAYVERLMTAAKQAILTHQNDPAKLQEAMHDFQRMQFLRNKLAQKLGLNIMR